MVKYVSTGKFWMLLTAASGIWLISIPGLTGPERAFAASQSWDAAGGGLLGTSGTWGTASNWWAGGPSDTTWVGGNTAFFAGTPGAVTISGSQNAGGLTFSSSGGYTLTGGTLNLAGAAPAISLTTSATETISSVLTGSGNFTIQAALGAVVFSAANTYSGETIVNSGVLSLTSTNGSNLGTATGAAAITLNHGEIQFVANSTFNTASISNSAGITLGASGGTINVNSPASGTFATNEAAVQYRGFIVGSGSLTVTGGSGTNSGTSPYLFELGATNSYSGPTIVNNAIVCFNNGNNGGTGPNNILPATTVLNLVNNGWFNFNNNGSFQTISGLIGDSTGKVSITNNSSVGGLTITPSTAATYTFAGVIGAQAILGKGGSGNAQETLTINGPGAEILTGPNTYTGATVISAGTLQVGAGGATGTIAIGSPITDNGTLAISRSNTVAQGTDFSSAAISGSGGLNKSGSSALILNAANTYSGGTVIGGGTLQLALATAVQNSTVTVNVPSNGLIFSPGIATFNLGGLAGTGSFAMSSTSGVNLALAVGANNNSTQFSGNLSGGSLTKAGSGTLTLSGSNTYIGSTTISGGILYESNTASLPNFSSGTIAVSSGAALAVQVLAGSAAKGFTDANIAALQANSNATFAAGSALGIDVVAGATYMSTANFAFGAGGNGLIKLDAGSLVLVNPNSYTGATTISAGTLQIGSAAVLGGGNYSESISNSGVLAESSSSNQTFGGVISGPGSLRQLGSGTLALTSSNTYSGGTNINNGTLSVGNASALGSSGAIVFGGGTLQFSAASTGLDPSARIAAGASTGAIAIDTNGQNVTFAAGLTASQSAGLTKIGSGTLTLGAADHYGGNTNIAGGELLVNGSISATSAITVSGSGALGGSGSAGNATVQSGGAIDVSANNGATLSLSGLTLGQSSTDRSTLSFSPGIPAVPQLALGALIANGGTGSVTINFGGSGAQLGTYTLATYSGGSIGGTGTSAFVLAATNSGLTNRETGALLLSTSAIDLQVTGSYPIWTGANSGLWVGGNNWKRNDTGGTTDFLAGDAVVFDDSAGTAGGNLNVTISSGNVSPGSVTFNNNGYAYTVSGPFGIAGGGGLTMNGTGSVTLSTSNTCTSATNVNAGILIVANSSGLATGSGPLKINGGTLQIGTGGAAGAVNSLPVINNGVLEFSRSDNGQVFANTISGSGSLIQLGPGMTTLTATNFYSGGTVIDGGVLSIATSNSLGTASGAAALTLNGGALQITGVTSFGTATIGSNSGITLGLSGGTINVTAPASGAFSTNETAVRYRGVISGSGNLTVTGGSGANSGTSPYLFELGATNSYTGTTTVNNAIVTFENGNPVVGGTGPPNILPVTTVLNLVNNGWFNLNNGIAVQTIAGLNGDATGRLSITNGSSPSSLTITPSAGQTSLFAGVIGAQTLLGKTGGNAELAVVINGAGLNGAGMQIFSGANTYSAATTIGAGTLQLGNGGNSGSIAASSVIDNGLLAISRSDNVSFNSLISGGTLAGSGSLVQLGPGTLIVSTSNAFGGGTALNGGMLVLANSSGSALGAAPLVINGGTLAGSTFGGTISGLVQAGYGPHTIAPGAGLPAGQYGLLNLAGGLVGNANTTLAFNLNLSSSSGTGANGVPVYIGDMINLGGPGLSGMGAFTFQVNPTGFGDYRLIGGTLGAPNLSNFTIPAPMGESYSLSTTADSGYLDLVVAPAATPTTYNLAATAASALVHVGASTTVTATITNTGTGLADTLDYSGLNIYTNNNFTSGSGLPIGGAQLAQGMSNSGSVTYLATAPGVDILTPAVFSATNDTIGGNATLTAATTASVSVFSGNGAWVSSSGSLWGVGASSHWIDSNGVQAAPGTFGSFANTDTATFNGSDSVPSVSLSSANPSLAALIVTGSNYMLSNGTLTLSSTGTASVTVSGTLTINSLLNLASTADVVLDNRSDLLALDGPIVGRYPLLMDGAGALILSNADNSYAGGTRVNSGTLVDAASGAIPDGSSLNIGPGATLVFDSTASGGPVVDSVEPSSRRLATVPEPSTFALLIAAAAGLATYLRRGNHHLFGARDDSKRALPVLGAKVGWAETGTERSLVGESHQTLSAGIAEARSTERLRTLHLEPEEPQKIPPRYRLKYSAGAILLAFFPRIYYKIGWSVSGVLGGFRGSWRHYLPPAGVFYD